MGYICDVRTHTYYIFSLKCFAPRPTSIDRPYQELGVRIGEQAVRPARLECPGRRDHPRGKRHDIRGGQVGALRIISPRLLSRLSTIAIYCRRRRWKCLSRGHLLAFMKKIENNGAAGQRVSSVVGAVGVHANMPRIKHVVLSWRKYCRNLAHGKGPPTVCSIVSSCCQGVTGQGLHIFAQHGQA